MIKEAHVFLENGGGHRLMREIVQALHPEYVRQPGLRLVRHDVPDWPAEPFAMAAVKLRMQKGMTPTAGTCLVQGGNACGKRQYLVMLKWIIGVRRKTLDVCQAIERADNVKYFSHILEER